MSWKTRMRSRPSRLSRRERLAALRALMLAALIATLPLVWLSPVAAANGKGAWFPASTPSTTPRSPWSPLDSQMVLLPDGRMLVGSGKGIALYDPLSGAWSAVAPTDPARGTDAPVLLADGRVLFTGGVHCEGISPSSCGAIKNGQVYDPATDSWAPIAPMPEPRDRHAAVRLADGSVLVAGGESARGTALGNCGSALREAWRYDPARDSWSSAGALSLRSANCQYRLTLLPDGRVLATGAYFYDPGSDPTTTPRGEIYDPATNSWSLTAPMTAAHAFGTATRLANGTVLVLGGRTGPDQGWSAAAEVYDPASDTWTAVAPMPTVREGGFTATLLPSGRVLVAGGRISCDPGCDPTTATADLYDPASDQWLPAASMHRARAGHGAALLPTGAVLVVGGYDQTNQGPGAELYYEHAPRPADRQPPPVDASADWIYFPETGHYLAFGFKGFWERSGGLPIFGYPLTEEFSEHNPESGQMLTVQYVERQRFEYHPEHAGTPYEVELGRVGAEDAARRNLLDTDAFHPLPSDTPSDVNCDFFPETGHRLCFGFRDYWQAHGLDFGDPVVSFRESLALFGYPISEEFTDPDTGLTVQYFERARFEYHPDNPEPHRVLLGRLGAEAVARQDWE